MKIYYLVAESYGNARNSPHLEVFKKRGIEVLLLFDRIDEWLMSALTDYDGKTFQDVMRGEVELPEGDDADADESSEQAPETSALTERIHWLLEHPSEWRAMLDFGRAHIEREFDLWTQGERVAEIYADAPSAG